MGRKTRPRAPERAQRSKRHHWVTSPRELFILTWFTDRSADITQ